MIGWWMVIVMAVGVTLQSAVLELEDLAAVQSHIQKAEHTLVVFGNSRTESWDRVRPSLEALEAGLAEHLPQTTVAIVDLFVVKEAIEHYKMTTNPSFFFFSNGERKDFKGAFDDVELFAMVSKAVKHWSFEVKNRIELIPKNLRKPYVYFEGRNEGDRWKNYLNASSLFDDLICLNKVTNEEGRIWIIRDSSHDGGDFSYSGDYTAESIAQSIHEERFPTGIEMDSEETAKFLFASRHAAKPTLMLFYNPGEEALVKSFKDTAKKVKRDYLISTAKIDNKYSVILADSIGMLPEDVPSVWMLKAASDKLLKYVMKAAITPANVLQFVRDYSQGSVPRHPRSEPVPARQEGAVVALVGATYERYRRDESSVLIVLYYASWCKHSQAFLPVFESWAEANHATELSVKHNIVFAKIDMARNEVFEEEEFGYPTIMCMPRREPGEDWDGWLEFAGARTREGLDKYMQEVVEGLEADPHAEDEEEEGDL
jgi:thiol-disulfide isomerase/thioredoxin